MPVNPSFNPGIVEQIAKLINHIGYGSDIAWFIKACGLEYAWDTPNVYPNQHQLTGIFLKSQESTGESRQILHFIESYLSPARFLDHKSRFEGYRAKLNNILKFSGIYYEENGTFKELDQEGGTPDKTRENTALAILKATNAHEEIYKYCEQKLLQENYFHAVFEANKGLLVRIRGLSGSQLDGIDLINQVFSEKNPILAFSPDNKRSHNEKTEKTKKSERDGVLMLLKGCVSMLRNPLAHEPEIYWENEDNALDYLILVSLMHKKLDHCIKVTPEND